MIVKEITSTFAEKMSNPAFMSVVFEGERRELKSLYGKMKRLQERKKPLVKNDFYYPTRWLGNLVERLGGNWRDVYCRGTWSDLKLMKDHLYFFTETAWDAPFDLLDYIKKVYPSTSYFFSAEGDDWETYLTNDKEGRYFSSRYVLDMDSDIDYYDTIEEVCRHLSAFIGKTVPADWESLCDLAEEWNEEHPDTDSPIIVKRFEIIEGS